MLAFMNRCGGAMVLFLLLSTGRALAEGSGAPLSSATPTNQDSKGVSPSSSPLPISTQGHTLDFDLLDHPPEGNPALKAVETARVERGVRTRRTMLLFHQGLGLATLAAYAVTDVVGQLNYNDQYGSGGGRTGQYKSLHAGLAAGTFLLFTSTALLGVLAPTPYPKHFQLDSAGLHKIFMSIATLSMVGQVVIGLLLGSHPGDPTWLTVHQANGYAGLGAMAAGAVVLVF